MNNLYNIEKAKACQNDLDLRVYTSNLLGQNDQLVLHGGGNTSVKSTVTTLLGDTLEVLFIKGSGWDLATIEPQGFPALDLNYLRRLQTLKTDASRRALRLIADRA